MDHPSVMTEAHLSNQRVRVGRLVLRGHHDHVGATQQHDRLVRIASQRLPTALGQLLRRAGIVSQSTLRVDQLSVPLDIDIERYSDDTIAFLWACRCLDPILRNLRAQETNSADQLRRNGKPSITTSRDPNKASRLTWESTSRELPAFVATGVRSLGDSSETASTSHTMLNSRSSRSLAQKKCSPWARQSLNGFEHFELAEVGRGLQRLYVLVASLLHKLGSSDNLLAACSPWLDEWKQSRCSTVTFRSGMGSDPSFFTLPSAWASTPAKRTRILKLNGSASLHLWGEKFVQLRRHGFSGVLGFTLPPEVVRLSRLGICRFLEFTLPPGGSKATNETSGRAGGGRQLSSQTRPYPRMLASSFRDPPEGRVKRRRTASRGWAKSPGTTSKRSKSIQSRFAGRIRRNESYWRKNKRLQRGFPDSALRQEAILSQKRTSASVLAGQHNFASRRHRTRKRGRNDLAITSLALGNRRDLVSRVNAPLQDSRFRLSMNTTLDVSGVVQRDNRRPGRVSRPPQRSRLVARHGLSFLQDSKGRSSRSTTTSAMKRLTYPPTRLRKLVASQTRWRRKRLRESQQQTASCLNDLVFLIEAAITTDSTSDDQDSSSEEMQSSYEHVQKSLHEVIGAMVESWKVVSASLALEKTVQRWRGCRPRSVPWGARGLAFAVMTHRRSWDFDPFVRHTLMKVRSANAARVATVWAASPPVIQANCAKAKSRLDKNPGWSFILRCKLLKAASPTQQSIHRWIITERRNRQRQLEHQLSTLMRQLSSPGWTAPPPSQGSIHTRVDHGLSGSEPGDGIPGDVPVAGATPLANRQAPVPDQSLNDDFSNDVPDHLAREHWDSEPPLVQLWGHIHRSVSNQWSRLSGEEGSRWATQWLSAYDLFESLRQDLDPCDLLDSNRVQPQLDGEQQQRLMQCRSSWRKLVSVSGMQEQQDLVDHELSRAGGLTFLHPLLQEIFGEADSRFQVQGPDEDLRIAVRKAILSRVCCDEAPWLYAEDPLVRLLSGEPPDESESSAVDATIWEDSFVMSCARRLLRGLAELIPSMATHDPATIRKYFVLRPARVRKSNSLIAWKIEISRGELDVLLDQARQAGSLPLGIIQLPWIPLMQIEIDPSWRAELD